MVVATLALIYAWLIYRSAWLSDDAFITLRTCDNALSGYGLRWNISERVQTFTHPLWMVVLLATHAAAGEPFYGTRYVSWLVSCAAVFVMLIGASGGWFERALALLLLIFSKSFVDYSTSGLENPLTHLWLACFVALYLRRPERAGIKALSWIAGLAALTRFDAALLYAPAWLVRARTSPRREALAALAIVVMPVLAWLTFSVIYYGFPWPNTAYAKLAVGEIAGRHRLLEAAHYFEATLRTDPLTLGAWVAIAWLVWRRRCAKLLALMAGSVLSLIYVVAIGGDFMAGRFFSAPFFMAVLCLANSALLSTRRARVLSLSVVALLIGLGERPALLTGADYGVDEATDAVSEHGIHDSRAEFFRSTSLVNAASMHPARREHPWTGHGHRMRERAADRPGARVQVVDAIGLSGYYAGPLVHIVDHWALADPLLARLPAAFGAVGHYTRTIPAGYLETLAGGRNAIVDPVIAEYYAQLAWVVRGDLFTWPRFRAIWALNTGAYDQRMRRALYADTDAILIRLKVTNVTDYRGVSIYVWNDFRQLRYVIDPSSQRGQSYEVSWRITAAGPVLQSVRRTPIERGLSTPITPQRTQGFQGLREGGLIALSAAFHSERPDEMDLYELHYYYKRSGAQLTVLREPLPKLTRGFPLGRWQQRPVAPAIELLEQRFE